MGSGSAGHGRWLALLACGALLAGCNDGGSAYYGGAGYGTGGGLFNASYQPLTPDERLLREQSDGFVQDNVFGGAATGAIIGCVLGAVAGALLAHDARSAAIGCGAGGLGGAVVGGVDGYMQAKSAQAQANQVLMTRAVAQDVRKQNEQLSAAVQTAQRVVDNDQRHLDELNAKLAAKQMTLDQARAEASVVRSNTQQIEAILADAQEKRDKFVQARNQLHSGDTAGLDAEIARLNREIAQLQHQVSSINASLQLNGLG